jgi:SAM-dependent methyltransferase
MNAAFEYAGTELGLFRDAHNWKGYLRAQIRPFLHGDVLEVGAGIGGTTTFLHDATLASWTCLEPDAGLLPALGAAVAAYANVRVVQGTLAALAYEAGYDSVLYIDVLEHIADDRGELEQAAARLRKGGHLIVLAPAHAWLYSAFDRAIGHHRRYDRNMLRRLQPSGLRAVRLRYLDSVGIAASLGNRLVTRTHEPTRAQIALWDRLMVPLSRMVDPWLGFRCGKSVLAVFRREG